MTDERQAQDATPMDAPAEIRDIHEVPAVEVITTTAVHLMTAAAVKCGLADSPDARELIDLDEARKLITALAGLVTAAAPEIGSQHAGPAANVCFRARLVGGTLTVSDESLALRWVAPADLDALEMHPTQRLRLSHFLEGRDAPYLG
ncbi:DUF1844 domain-containing protein [Micrococcus luteus]|uniref:DUF1844 domain-containing protein n=1 Tax=Micrococcus luteus TaxID=1270 RepID=UPI00342E2D5E